jgi:DNA-directed RNA polymerase specialized sigma24 family protein
MSSEGSVTHWLRLLQTGDHSAAQPLWQHYFQLLVGRARAALSGLPRRAADEEDVALGAFASFWRGAEQGRFPNLNDRHDLWRLLVLLTAGKVARLVRGEFRQKRGAGRVCSEADLVRAGAAKGESLLEQVVGQEPTPEFAAQLVEECQQLLDKLGSDELRSIAVWQMEGYTVDEIGDKLGHSSRTVARKLRLIRGLWREECPA